MTQTIKKAVLAEILETLKNKGFGTRDYIKDCGAIAVYLRRTIWESEVIDALWEYENLIDTKMAAGSVIVRMA